MSTRTLPHYLRSHRKRTGFSQDELAILLGCRSGSKVSRYERFTRKPTLETVFAYQVLFRAPADELFAGIYGAVEQITHRRVRRLLKHFAKSDSNRATLAKIDQLRSILESRSNRPPRSYA